MSAEDLERRTKLARDLGARITRTAIVEMAGRSYPVLEFDVRDNDHAMDIFESFALDDAAHDIEVRALAARLAARVAGIHDEGEREIALARAIHRYVQGRVTFQEEEQETLRSGSCTLHLGFGDCEDHGCLVLALGVAGGLRPRPRKDAPGSRLERLRDEAGDVVHACAMLRAGGVDHWCETTCAARFGEHPAEAAARLGLLEREDVTGVR